MERSRECVLGRRQGFSKGSEMEMCLVNSGNNEETGLLKIFTKCLPYVKQIEATKKG